jgi:hypothetical protein
MVSLVLHCGAHHVKRETMLNSRTPPASQSRVPVPHHRLLEQVENTITAGGLRIINEAHALWNDGLRYFGLLEVANGDAHEDYGLVIGLRNSHDKNFPGSDSTRQRSVRMRQPCAPCGVSSGCRSSPAIQAVMNYLISLTSTRQRDETSKEAGDNSMTEKPACRDPDIPKSHRQEEEHKAKAKLPEPQIETGGSHSPPTPDTGRIPNAVRSVRLCEQGRAGNKPDNDRTGRLRAHDHHYLCTTGSPNQAVPPAWRRSPHSTRRAEIAPGAADVHVGHNRDITSEQSLGRSLIVEEGGQSEVPRRTLKRRTTNVDR